MVLLRELDQIVVDASRQANLPHGRGRARAGIGDLLVRPPVVPLRWSGRVGAPSCADDRVAVEFAVVGVAGEGEGQVEFGEEAAEDVLDAGLAG